MGSFTSIWPEPAGASKVSDERWFDELALERVRFRSERASIALDKGSGPLPVRHFRSQGTA